MKSTYTTPTAEKITFQYRNQVVASSTGTGGGNYSCTLTMHHVYTGMEKGGAGCVHDKDQCYPEIVNPNEMN